MKEDRVNSLQVMLDINEFKQHLIELPMHRKVDCIMLNTDVLTEHW